MRADSGRNGFLGRPDGLSGTPASAGRAGEGGGPSRVSGGELGADAAQTGELPPVGAATTAEFLRVMADSGEAGGARDDDEDDGAPVPGVLVFRPRAGADVPRSEREGDARVDAPAIGDAPATGGAPTAAEAPGMTEPLPVLDARTHADTGEHASGGSGSGGGHRGTSRLHAALSGRAARLTLRVAGLALGVVVLVGGGFALGTRFGTQVVDRVFPSVAANRPQEQPRSVELADGYDGALTRRVAAAAADVTANALSAPSLDEATAGAIGGVLTSSGDVDAAYLTQEEYDRRQRLASGAGAGIGASFVDGDDGPVVALIAQGSPAQDVGLRPGDTVVALDGRRDALSAVELTDALAQAAGTDVELTWVSAAHGAGGASGAEETAATLRPSDEVTAPLVDARLEGETGVLTLLRLGTGVADGLAQAISDLTGRGATSFVLDLRDSAGDDLSEALRVASLFMEGGTVATATTRDGTERLDVIAGLHVTDAPLVLLVSNDTAGAAEILAGALQDHQRALVVGELTHGTGGTQALRTLSFGGALSYTTATYETPDGYAIQGQGIAPDLLASPTVTRAARLAAGPADDGQLKVAVDAARAWERDGSIAIEGLSNAPGPQTEAFDQARKALEEAQLRAAAAQVSAADAVGSTTGADTAGGQAAQGAGASAAGEPGEQTAQGGDAPIPAGDPESDARTPEDAAANQDAPADAQPAGEGDVPADAAADDVPAADEGLAAEPAADDEPAAPDAPAEARS